MPHGTLRPSATGIASVSMSPVTERSGGHTTIEIGIVRPPVAAVSMRMGVVEVVVIAHCRCG